MSVGTFRMKHNKVEDVEAKRKLKDQHVDEEEDDGIALLKKELSQNIETIRKRGKEHSA